VKGPSNETRIGQGQWASTSAPGLGGRDAAHAQEFAHVVDLDARAKGHQADLLHHGIGHEGKDQAVALFAAHGQGNSQQIGCRRVAMSAQDPGAKGQCRLFEEPLPGRCSEVGHGLQLLQRATGVSQEFQDLGQDQADHGGKHFAAADGGLENGLIEPFTRQPQLAAQQRNQAGEVVEVGLIELPAPFSCQVLQH
jgi:hypothetical protein